MTKAFLEMGGDLAVHTLGSAVEALELLSRERFDAVVSDYQMPEMDGISFLRAVRATDDRTPFVIFTGKGRQEVAIDALNAGADFYVQKGGDPKVQFGELRNAVVQLIKRRRAEADLRGSQSRLRTIFEENPVMMALVDMERRISHINRAFMEFSGKNEPQMMGLFPGNALGCVNSTDAPGGCGSGASCHACPVNQIITTTVNTGEAIRRRKVAMALRHHGRTEERVVLISASRVPSPGEDLILLCLEDITSYQSP